jgi:lipooligosaccharide transport system permease protein
MGIGMGSYITLGGGQSIWRSSPPGLVAASAMNGATFETTYNVYVRIAFQHVYEGVLTTPVSAADVALGKYCGR